MEHEHNESSVREKFAAIAFTSSGHQCLRYFEPDGDDTIIHNVIEIDGATIDMKLHGFTKMPDDKFEEMKRLMIDDFDTGAADQMFSRIIGQLGLEG